MINIAICDDNKTICSQLENILLEYADQVCLKIEIGVFFSGESLLDYIKMGNKFDLIYLDIEMGGMNGVEVGKQLRKVFKDYTTEIVYVSGNDGYDRQLFDVQPLHFIPKPIIPSTAIDDLNLALERINKAPSFFKYQKGHTIYQTPIQEIIYFESHNREVKMVTIRGEDYFYGSLDDVASEVLRYQFLRIHRSFLINYTHVTMLRYSDLTMSNDITSPISRTKRHEVRKLQINEF